MSRRIVGKGTSLSLTIENDSGFSSTSVLARNPFPSDHPTQLIEKREDGINGRCCNGGKVGCRFRWGSESVFDPPSFDAPPRVVGGSDLFVYVIRD